MLINLRENQPHIDPSEYEGSLVVEFSRFTGHGGQALASTMLERGQALVSAISQGEETVTKVSLHLPVIYNIYTLRPEPYGRARYVITLMQGTTDWCIDLKTMEDPSVTLSIPKFNPGLFPGAAQQNRRSLWDHLDDPV